MSQFRKIRHRITWNDKNRGYVKSVNANGHTIEIGAGSTDTVIVRKISNRGYPDILIASVNRLFGYAGLEIFDTEKEFLHEGPFLQNSQDIEYVLGKKGLELEDSTILRKLANFYYETL